MGIDQIFGIAGSALNAQTTRMNAVASNLANAGTVAGSDKDAFRGKRTVFKAVLEESVKPRDLNYKGGVKVDALTDDPSPVRRISDPGNPLADKDGFVYLSNDNEMTEMVEMMAATRSYQNNVEVVNTARQLRETASSAVPCARLRFDNRTLPLKAFSSCVILAAHEMAPKQLPHNMSAQNRPYSRHTRGRPPSSILHHRSSMQPAATALTKYAAICSAAR